MRFYIPPTKSMQNPPVPYTFYVSRFLFYFLRRRPTKKWIDLTEQCNNIFSILSKEDNECFTVALLKCSQTIRTYISYTFPLRLFWKWTTWRQEREHHPIFTHSCFLCDPEKRKKRIHSTNPQKIQPFSPAAFLSLSPSLATSRNKSNTWGTSRKKETLFSVRVTQPCFHNSISKQIFPVCSAERRKNHIPVFDVPEVARIKGGNARLYPTPKMSIFLHTSSSSPVTKPPSFCVNVSHRSEGGKYGHILFPIPN